MEDAMKVLETYLRNDFAAAQFHKKDVADGICMAFNALFTNNVKVIEVPVNERFSQDREMWSIVNASH